MLTKLTLTIDQQVIEQAKQYAQKNHRSVSRLVEEYLRNVSSGNETAEFKKNLNSPITDSLVGMFQDNGQDYKTMIEDAITEKHR